MVVEAEHPALLAADGFADRVDRLFREGHEAAVPEPLRVELPAAERVVADEPVGEVRQVPDCVPARRIELGPPQLPGPIECRTPVGLGHVRVENTRKEGPWGQGQTLQQISEPVAEREPFAEMTAQNLALPVDAVDEFQVVVDDVSHGGGLRDAQACHVTRKPVAEERFGCVGTAEEGVVVEEHEMLGEPLDAGDIQGFSDIMREFIINHDRYKECGENGRKYFLHNYKKDIFMDKLESRFGKTER